MDNRQGVCLFYQRTGTCRDGDNCPLSHVQEERGITTKYDDRIWQSAQASTSGSNQSFQPGCSKQKHKQQKQQQQKESEQQQTQWDFRVMTYNILAEGLATAHGELLYQQVPAWCLKWEYRWPGLLAEIAHYRPDVMSLQEVDHMDELSSRLESLGYEGRYAQRSGGRSDGCATFWRKDVFVAVAVDIIRFQSYGLQDNVALLVLLHRKSSFPEGEDAAGSDGVVEVRMTVDESGDVSMLSGEVQKWFTLHAELPVETLMDPALLIANTHILFNPKRGDIKIAQLRTLLNVMNDIVRKCNGNALGMVMGDFNSTPQSAVYHFIKAGELDCQTVPRKHVSGQVQGTSWPAALEKMARQRSAPAALSIPSDKALMTPPVTPNSPQKSDFWGSPPRKSPTHRNPRKKPTRGMTQTAASRLGMKHVASEPQLMAMGASDFEGNAKDIVQPVKLTAHTVPVLQTLPDETPPLSSTVTSPRDQPKTAPASHSASSSASHVTVPSRPTSISGSRGMLSPLGQSPPTPKPLDDSTAAAIAKAVHTDDASLLNSVLPSIKSSMHSTTSLSTIAESSSSPECSAQDLAALDQVAERLCELDNALASETSQTLDSERSNSGLKQLLKDQPGGTFQVSASSSSASMDKQASEAQPPQPAETTHTESASAKSAGDKAADNASEASDAPASSSFVAPLFQHFPSHSFATDAAREESSSGLDSGLHRDFNASTGSFAGFELARAKAAHELFCRSSQGSEHASVSSEASTPAMHECTSGKHCSPFIAQKVEPESTGEQQQQGQDPGHLLLPSGPRLSVDGVLPQADGGTAGGGEGPYGPPELGRASPRPPIAPVLSGKPPSPTMPPLPPVKEAEPSDLEQRDSSTSVLSPTSQLAKDIGMFSPRRLPPKLSHTRETVSLERRSSLERRPSWERRPSFNRNDIQRPFGDRSSGDGGRSNPSPRGSLDGGSHRPPVVLKPLFRDDSCTWSPEQLKMAVGFPPEDLAEPAIARADSVDTPGSRNGSSEDPEPTWVARHPLKLRSAYSEVTGSEPPYTTCHSKFLGTVDYMWYTPNADQGTTLLPTRTLLPPPLQHLYCGLPSPEWQSDHMSLVTDFSVQRKSSKNSVLLSGLHKEANMVRARSKLVDSSVYAAAMAAANQDRT